MHFTRSQKLATTLFSVLALLFFFSLPSTTQAATKYWVGGNGDNGGTNANDWSTSDPASCNDGGGDAGTVPGSSDIAVFDADCDSNATIAANWSVAGIDMKSGYTGTVTQNTSITVTVGTSDWIQAEGTFTGGNSTIDMNDDFTLSGGTFTSTSGTLFVAGTFKRSSGTFTHNSGNVVLDNTASKTLTNTQNFNNLTINDGLVGYWKLDETSGTSAADSSGYGNTGTYGATTAAPTPSATAPTVDFTDTESLSFDGGDKVDISTKTGLDAASFTVAGWINLTANQ